MSTTQQHLLISDIKENILILKNGGGALVLQVSAVNFGLLSDREQLGIISSFAQMLNSLSFPIQIVIRSERLNINSYLKLLDKSQKAQTNPLLSKLIASYRQFIQTTIKENDVLDKKFYLVIPLFALELGLIASKQVLQQKIKTILLPRRDQIIRQINRVGLRTNQLTNQELIELFYDIYNGALEEKLNVEKEESQPIEVSLKQPETALPASPTQRGEQPTSEQLRNTQNISVSDSQINRISDISGTPSSSEPLPPPVSSGTGQVSKNHPFVVEELEDT